MIAFLCWSLIATARALEWARIGWGTLIIETRLARWTTRRLAPGSGVLLLTGTGIVLTWPFAWMYPAAVWLTRLANRGLPPLPRDAGFLTRLYERPFMSSR